MHLNLVVISLRGISVLFLIFLVALILALGIRGKRRPPAHHCGADARAVHRFDVEAKVHLANKSLDLAEQLFNIHGHAPRGDLDYSESCVARLRDVLQGENVLVELFKAIGERIRLRRLEIWRQRLAVLDGCREEGEERGDFVRGEVDVGEETTEVVCPSCFRGCNWIGESLRGKSQERNVASDAAAKLSIIVRMSTNKRGATYFST